ncbi:hypothetical protein KSP40_PGU000347 [Platanthera guangdongensis]|uniref:J domain-containing protein n=1 Tax=Platanthera guangdongensis TaxID=2320717 RepID=A0ABR2MHK4_9ASPA
MTAYESTIKKQFRQLALLLHPDKNKFVGAEGTFQEIKNEYMLCMCASNSCIFDRALLIYCGVPVWCVMANVFYSV